MPRQHPTSVPLVYELEGDVDSIDVFALAPTLLSLGKLIQDSNLTLNGPNTQISVNVKPFRPGSFAVDIALFQDPAVQIGLGFAAAAASDPTMIRDVLKTIGLIQDVRTSAIEAMRKLRGKPAKIEALGPDEIRYSADEHTSITVSAPVNQLLQNSTIVQHIQHVYHTPMSSPMVTGIKSYIRGDEKGTTVRMDPADMPAVNTFVTGEPSPEAPKIRLDTVVLNPSRGSFEGEGGHWSFRRGPLKIRATIRDKSFLERCRLGDIRLHATDLLKVELQETETLHGNKVGLTFEIVRVLNYKPGPKQASLGLVPPPEG